MSEVSGTSPESVDYSSETISTASGAIELGSSQTENYKPNNIVSSSSEVYVPSDVVVYPDNVTVIEYGKSGLERPLNVMVIQPVDAKKKVLVTFELHGFEGSYPHDGQALVDIGNALIEYFAENPEQLCNTALYIVPSANPDGLIDGSLDNGPGRCQVSLGVDINRDFDYRWEKETSTFNKTLSPFSCPESQALRDLVIEIKPDDVIDIHGWFATSYGNSSLCQYFNVLGIYRSNCLGTPGYFTSWARKYSKRVALIELSGPKTDPQKVIDAFVNLCAE
ncbi:MAG TPA: M14 family zinc carboxypeptidase [Oscillospiraceae bacterium]|nr:M14 family zinc carboxypeptidase [Oscillospiraceae bacterium]